MTMARSSCRLTIFLLFVLAVAKQVGALQPSRRWMLTQCCGNQRIATLLVGGKSHIATSATSRSSFQRVAPLFESKNNDDDGDKMMQESSSSSSFDGRGFANYLAPYALALVGSIAVTALFVKFVLLDY